MNPGRASQNSGRLTVVALLAIAMVVAGALARARRGIPAQPRFLPLTTLAGNETSPAVSPDGAQIVFAWDQGSDQPTSLYLKQVTGEDPLRLTDEGGSDRAPIWSPDGSSVGFVRLHAGVCELRSVAAAGGPSHRLASCSDPDHPRFSWSPDARSLLLTAQRRDAPGAGLHLLTLATLETRELPTGAPGDGADVAATFSPDGRQIAFVRELGPGVGDLYLVAAAGGEPHRLTFDDADVRGMAWFAGGQQLVYSTNRAGMYSLWSVAAGGGAPVLVAGGSRGVEQPSASTAGDVIAFEDRRFEIDLWRQPLGNQAVAGSPVASATDAWIFEPRFSPDAQRIAFVSTRSGSSELWLCRSDGTAATRLTAFEAGVVSSPRFSPDGRQIAFIARPRGGADVYVADLTGGPLRWLTQSPGDEVAPSFSADGRFVYYGARAGGTWQLRKRALASNQDVAIGVAGYSAQESRDGRWLYFARSDRSGLWRMPTAGGPAVAVAPDLAPADRTSWGSVEAGVYWFAAGPRDAARVLLLRPGAATPERLAIVPELGWPGLDLAPDASALLYSRVGRHDSNIGIMTSRP